MKKLIVLLSLALGGCVTDGATTSLEPVCAALGDPMVYNSRNPQSAWHAGTKLAPRIAQQNRVGVNLNCPAYRSPATPVAGSVTVPVPRRKPTFAQRFERVWAK